MKTKKFTYRKAKKYDLWYCKDRRLLLYLGDSPNEEHIWLWVGTMMTTETYSYYNSLDEEYILEHLENHLDYLAAHIQKQGQWKEKGLLLTYKGIPNVVAYVSHWEHPVASMLSRQYTVQEEQKTERVKVVLKPGYIYEKRKTGENYLYCGKRRVCISSSYSIKDGIRTVHLFMFCGYGNKTSESLRQELSFRIRGGYDGNFSINFRLKDLEEIGYGCEIPGNKGDLWILGLSSGRVIEEKDLCVIGDDIYYQ